MLHLAMIVMPCLIVSGLIASWFVAGSLVAPSPLVLDAPPAELNSTSFTIDSDSGSRISGWHNHPSPDPTRAARGVIVLLHGIRGSRMTMLGRARLLHQCGYSTVMIDFQAHGESPGEAITIGHLERHDVRAAVEYARREHPGEPIGVLGVSLGGAAAVLASPLNIDALVLESVYPDINSAVRNRVAGKWGLLASIPTSILIAQLQPRLGISPDQLRPIDHVPNVGCPVFLVSGRADQHTTATETLAMFAAAADPKQLWLIEDAAHVDLLTIDPGSYREQVVVFFDRYLGRTTAKSNEH